MPAPNLDIHYIAHLARMALTPAEEIALARELGGILGYIEKLNGLDLSGVEPTAHAVPITNVTRSDEAHPSLPREEALRNAPASANGLFMVPKIVE